jgi:hypothetical protein
MLVKADFADRLIPEFEYIDNERYVKLLVPEDLYEMGFELTDETISPEGDTIHSYSKEDEGMVYDFTIIYYSTHFFYDVKQGGSLLARGQGKTKVDFYRMIFFL